MTMPRLSPAAMTCVEQNRPLALVWVHCDHRFFSCACGQNRLCLRCGWGWGALPCGCDGVLIVRGEPSGISRQGSAKIT